jgi:hypothetical protein
VVGVHPCQEPAAIAAEALRDDDAVPVAAERAGHPEREAGLAPDQGDQVRDLPAARVLPQLPFLQRAI